MIIVVVVLILLVLVLAIIVARLWAALTRERANVENAIRQASKRSVTTSRAVTLGNVSQQVAPLLPGFRYDPTDVQWIGGTVDCVVWDGLNSGDGDVTVVFLDVKSGKAQANKPQRRIRDAINAGRVRFELYRLPLHAIQPTVPALTFTAEGDPAAVRAWAKRKGYQVSPQGRLPNALIEAYRRAHASAAAELASADFIADREIHEEEESAGPPDYDTGVTEEDFAPEPNDDFIAADEPPLDQHRGL